jgi:hypothetical protein
MHQLSSPLSENADSYFISNSNKPSGQEQKNMLLQKFPSTTKVHLTPYTMDKDDHFPSDKFAVA